MFLRPFFLVRWRVVYVFQKPKLWSWLGQKQNSPLELFPQVISWNFTEFHLLWMIFWKFSFVSFRKSIIYISWLTGRHNKYNKIILIEWITETRLKGFGLAVQRLDSLISLRVEGTDFCHAANNLLTFPPQNMTTTWLRLLCKPGPGFT